MLTFSPNILGYPVQLLQEYNPLHYRALVCHLQLLERAGAVREVDHRHVQHLLHLRPASRPRPLRQVSQTSYFKNN
jgi:hypothetical protein